MFRTFLTLLLVSGAIGFAAPAYGDPGDASGTDDAGFLSALRNADIGYGDPAQVIGSAKAVCTCLDSGETGYELIHDVKKRNPGFSLDAAAEFAVISARFYCPHQLAKA